ncbi:MAG TPA: hypothetical protein VKR79_09850 [Gaiellaceae bacterium]|nr:hypothetical protein [Gaiellaceae bacterium]
MWSGYSIVHNAPGAWSENTSGATIARYLSLHRDNLSGGLFMQGLAAVLLVSLVLVLYELLAGDGGWSWTRGGFLSCAVIAAAIDLVGLVSGVALVQVTPAAATGATATLWYLNLATEGAIGFPLAAMLLLLGVVIWRSSVLPRWSAVVSFAAAVSQVACAVSVTIHAWGKTGGGPQTPAWLAGWSLLTAGALLLERRRSTAPVTEPRLS